MNWKEQLPGMIRESRFFSEAVATENLQLFIRDEIIQKLIDDIPEWLDSEPHNLKQQLKANWLERN